MASPLSPHVSKHDIQFLLDGNQRPTDFPLTSNHPALTALTSPYNLQHHRRMNGGLSSSLSQPSFPSGSHPDLRSHYPLSPQSTPSNQSSQTSRSTHSPSSCSPPLPLSPNFCKDCSQSFSSPQQLATHVRTAHRLKPFACKLCDKTFAERGNANKHYRVAHLKQRNHRCSTCNRCFAFRDGLNRHISMVHLNERPFECTECMCPAGPHPSDIPCTHICGMRFKQKSHRRRHVLSVHQAARRNEDQHGSFSSLPHLRLPPHRSQQVL